VASLLSVLQVWRRCLKSFDGEAALRLRPQQGGVRAFSVRAAGDLQL
jgi:hypothetical protein